MRDNEGFDILHNGVPRTFRDQKAMAYEAARFAKTQNPADLIEIVHRSIVSIAPLLCGQASPPIECGVGSNGICEAVHK